MWRGQIISNIILFERQTVSLVHIEKELYQLYTSLSEKVQDVATKTLFSYIATDSLKHSAILVKIIEEICGSKAPEQSCDENTEEIKEVIKEITKNVAKSTKINRKELITLIDALADFENLLFNEYQKAFNLEYAALTESAHTHNNAIDMNIFKLIVEDEERHQRILASVTRLCDRNLSFNRNAPIAKCKNQEYRHVNPRAKAWERRLSYIMNHNNLDLHLHPKEGHGS